LSIFFTAFIVILNNSEWITRRCIALRAIQDGLLEGGHLLGVTTPQNTWMKFGWDATLPRWVAASPKCPNGYNGCEGEAENSIVLWAVCPLAVTPARYLPTPNSGMGLHSTWTRFTVQSIAGASVASHGHQGTWDGNVTVRRHAKMALAASPTKWLSCCAQLSRKVVWYTGNRRRQLLPVCCRHGGKQLKGSGLASRARDNTWKSQWSHLLIWSKVSHSP